MQISGLTIAMLAINALVGIALPIGMLIFIRKRFGSSLVPFFYGCGAFLLFALVLESIVHNVVLTSAVGQSILNSTWLYALYGGLMAGLFEETGRLAAMKLLRKKHNRPDTALMYGAGHGGFEAVAVLTSTMVTYIVYAVMINGGQMEQILASMDEANQAALMEVVNSLTQSAPLPMLLASVERIAAVILHVALSVLVWQAAVKPGKLGFYFLAIVLHALMDAIAVILSRSGVPALILELILLAFACCTALYARKVYTE